MRRITATTVGAALALASACTIAAPDPAVARGRYLIQVGGCNDCHTPGFAPSGGKTPEADWLVGDGLGFQGPWGTTYASNLRLTFKDMTEAQWMEKAKTFTARPPMPFWAVTSMTEADRRALFRYVKSLPVKGEAAPAYVPPGQAPKGPAVVWPSPPTGK